jgi:hypothetical protein
MIHNKTVAWVNEQELLDEEDKEISRLIMQEIKRKQARVEEPVQQCVQPVDPLYINSKDLVFIDTSHRLTGETSEKELVAKQSNHTKKKRKYDDLVVHFEFK